MIMHVFENTSVQHTENIFKLIDWTVPIVLAVVLIVISVNNLLLFHTLAEFFAITIAILTCVIAWNMYPFTRNDYLMFLGAGYFWIGVLDLLHTFSYKGLNILQGGGVNMATQFWIGTRYLEALLLLSAPWFLTHKLNRAQVFTLFGVGACLIIYSVIAGIFPHGYIEGKGLTGFKVYSEYAIISLLSLAIYYLYKRKNFLTRQVVKALIVSIALTMCAELSFTFYINIHDFSNIFGHIFKLFSFWIIYITVVRTTLHEPFAFMSKRSTTYDAIPDAIIVIDQNGVIRQANNTASELSGISIEELIGKTSHDIFHDKNVGTNQCPVCVAVNTHHTIDSVEIEVNESAYDYSLSFIDADVHEHTYGAVEVIRNVTKRKETDKKIKELNVLKENIIENLPAMLFVKDAKDLKYIEWNKAAENLTGIPKVTIIGQSDCNIWPNEQAELFTQADRAVLENGELLDIEEETITTQSKGIRSLHTRKIPIYDEKGEAKYLLGISEDITDKLKTEEMLRRSMKMEAVGQMSGGIAHDFNNQLGVIGGYLELSIEKNKDEQLGKWMGIMQTAAQRCVDLTKQLLIFSRAEQPNKETINVNEAIEGIKSIISGTVTPQIRVNYVMANNLWNTDLNQGDFKDAILNLIINARDAMEHGGSLEIETSNISLDETSKIINSEEMKAGDYVLIKVSDTGTGMSKEVVEHIFEPFFTTKVVGKGTGLGLAMVYGFAHRYGGAIDVESEVNKGTSFRIYLPKSTLGNDLHGKEVDNRLRTGTESILVVDDEADLLDLTETYLSELGYTVYKASNGADALLLLQGKNKIDMLFTDVVMPGGMNGYKLSQAALENHPGIKILLSSGYLDKVEDSAEIRQSGLVVLGKPYNKFQLSASIRQVLDS